MIQKYQKIAVAVAVADVAVAAAAAAVAAGFGSARDAIPQVPDILWPSGVDFL